MQLRIVHERAGKGHLLPHALGKSLATLMRMRLEAQPAYQLARASLRCGWFYAPESRNEFKIFVGRELVVDHRLVRQPGRDLLGAHRVREGVDAVDADRTCIGEAADDHPKGRGLAGAIWTDQSIELAAIDGQIELVDGEAVKPLADAAELKGDWKILLHLERPQLRRTSPFPTTGVVSLA